MLAYLVPRTSEKLRKVLDDQEAGTDEPPSKRDSQTSRKNGHGSNSAAAYASAPKVEVPPPDPKSQRSLPGML